MIKNLKQILTDLKIASGYQDAWIEAEKEIIKRELVIADEYAKYIKDFYTGVSKHLTNEEKPLSVNQWYKKNIDNA